MVTLTEVDPDPEAVTRFVATLAPGRAEEAGRLVPMMQRAAAAPPRLWGGKIVGFGRYAYTYPSGHSGQSFLTGLAPGKARLSFYVMPGFEPFADELARLGPHRLGRGCLYVTRLARIDVAVLERILTRSVEIMRARYPEHWEV
jgi:hypothetical protein